MSEGFDREEEMQHRQGGALYPLGRSLRSTFPTLDGDELQPRIMSLMVELSHQPYEREPIVPAASPPRPSPPPTSLLRHLTRLFRRG